MPQCDSELRVLRANEMLTCLLPRSFPRICFRHLQSKRFPPTYGLQFRYRQLVQMPTGRLSDSPYLDDLDHICGCFDKATKTRFRSASEPQYIRFGSTRDNDPSCDIRFGQLKMEGCGTALSLVCPLADISQGFCRRILSALH